MGHRVEVLRNGERFHTLAHVQMLGKAVPKAPLSFPNIQFTAAATPYAIHHISRSTGVLSTYRVGALRTDNCLSVVDVSLAIPTSNRVL